MSIPESASNFLRQYAPDASCDNCIRCDHLNKIPVDGTIDHYAGPPFFKSVAHLSIMWVLKWRPKISFSHPGSSVPPVRFEAMAM
jgi:hypothetical protein